MAEVRRSSSKRSSTQTTPPLGRKLSSQIELAAEQKALEKEQDPAALDPDDEEEPEINPLLGKTVADRYELRQVLGEGGWGIVFLAYDQQSKQNLALKLLHPHMALQADMRKRFRREAESVSRLSHPVIVKIEDFGESTEGPYMVMELIDGVPLDFIIDSAGATPVEEVLPTFIQICSAMTHAHERGVIHRDLKPSNIMLVSNPDGSTHVKLLDFGLAKPQENKGRNMTKLTATGMVLGTADYISPEQVRGQQADERSDIYSFACTVFETITGMPLFDNEDDDDMAILQAHVFNIPKGFERIVSRQPQIRDQVETVLLKALEKDRSNRYQSFTEFEQALSKIHENCDAPANLIVRSNSALSLACKRSETYTRFALANKLIVSLLITGILLAMITCGSVYLLVPSGSKLPDLSGRWLPLASKKIIDPAAIEQTMQMTTFVLHNGHDNDALADAARTRGECLIAQDQYGDAEKLLQEAINYHSGSAGTLSQFVAEVEHELGSCFLHDNKLKPAREALQKSIDTWQQLFPGDNERQTIPTLELGEIDYKLKEFADAAKCFQFSTKYGDVAARALASSELGDTYLAQKNPEGARKSFEEALILWQQAGNAYLVNKALCNVELARSLDALGNHAAAVDENYQAAMNALKDANAALYKDVCRHYAAFLLKQGRLIEAMNMQSKIQKLPGN